ncbi:glycoside hydrolase family 26 protein [Pelagicoccus albus]|uniref:Glycosyl hydrolase family 26 n=1 Tax=Pelagicoccus albus TaxID=415222 RepID=A0A7X1B3T4_9BACT|nr:glycosyl hydrolase [Pelagicoccus albus]MBC2605126.1 glycosyl hydrolase family 26 [Pelagicoccus albus]
MLRTLSFTIAAGIAVAASTQSTELENTLEATALRTQFEVGSNTANSKFGLQLSTDLESWQDYILDFDSDGQNWFFATDAPLSVVEENALSNGNWEFVCELILSGSNFLRLVRLEGPFSADPSVTEETANLLKNLHRIGWDPNRYAFGQEFPLSFNSTDNIGSDDIDQSESKDVVGDHPGVHGSDFLYMIDQPWHEDLHKAAAVRAYESGAIVTFDYHWPGKYGGSYQAHEEDDTLLDYVVRGDDSRGDVTWFYESLDRILAIINEDLRFPIVFRPFHEMDGAWFWWGSQMQGGAETYRAAYRLLVEYMRERTDYVLFCWSPDVALQDFEQFYPGDDYVDMIGRDIYNMTESGRPISKLTEIIAFAEERGKVAALTETGYTLGGSFETADPDWWTTHILDPIAEDPEAGKIAWVLTWINAQWSGPYIPNSDSPQAAKDDFIKFYEAEETLFQADVSNLNVYSSPPED